jgi:hypothetical protein
MTWIAATSNPNLAIRPGPFTTMVTRVASQIQIDSLQIIPIGNLDQCIGNPLTLPFTRAIVAGRPVEGGGGSARPTSGLVYPRKV